MSTSKNNVDIKVQENIPIGAEALVGLAKVLDPSITLVIQGETGVGKTEIVYQLATTHRNNFYANEENCKRMVDAWNSITENTARLETWNYEMGLPVVSRRLSQMTEGDLLGVPQKAANGGTSFTCSDWVRFATQFPCVLFLDERNRAVDAVKQAVFEMLDEHRFHGFYFHKGTYLYVAENIGGDYQVAPLDPAELSKAALVLFKPTVKDWTTWARNHNLAEPVVAFIEEKEVGNYGSGILEVDAKAQRIPGVKVPDRRAWTKLARELDRLKMFEKHQDPMFQLLCSSMVGTQVALMFVAYMKENWQELTVEDVLDNWSKTKKKIREDAPASMWIGVTEKINRWLVDNEITKKQGENYSEFAKAAPAEIKMMVWVGLAANEKNLLTAMPYISPIMVAHCGS